MVTVRAEPKGDGWVCDVSVDHAGRRTRHAVTVTRGDLERWAGAGERVDVESLVARSFDFLLEREPPGAILASFDLSVIQHYFPEYDSAFRRPHAGEGRGAGDSHADLSGVRALTFDIFGTAVDWRSGVAAEAQRLGALNGVHADWERLADAWRALYVPSMDRVRRGELPWTNFDRLHRLSLDQVLHDVGAEGFNEDAREELTFAWERLPPWPDAAHGLARLTHRFTVTTLSNGNRSQQAALISFAGLPFQRLLSAEDFRHYKPDPEVYLGAASALGLEAGQVMMVAAHKSDLRAAQAAGLRAAFVERPLEKGPAGSADVLPDPRSDVEATDFIDLADKLGC